VFFHRSIKCYWHRFFYNITQLARESYAIQYKRYLKTVKTSYTFDPTIFQLSSRAPLQPEFPWHMWLEYRLVSKRKESTVKITLSVILHHKLGSSRVNQILFIKKGLTIVQMLNQTTNAMLTAMNYKLFSCFSGILLAIPYCLKNLDLNQGHSVFQLFLSYFYPVQVD